MSDPQTIKQAIELEMLAATLRGSDKLPAIALADLNRIKAIEAGAAALRARPVEPSAPAQEPIHCYAHASGSCVALKKLAALRQSSPAQEIATFNFKAHLQRQREFSERTFGPGERSQGVIDHIRKELREIEAEPRKLSEWIDVVILALDGAWRAGHSPEAIQAALVAKQDKNEAREWPDWRTADPNKAIEHVRVPAPPMGGSTE